ncbi:hypothetical protein C9J03_00965 [Photobacterium gaetbulicola]|uniref:Uncharacterized protein n=1 Tax=Photobacterium gaetbulicola Gung47 TaxID=658445 RepID=A0A0C5W2Y1_9GAMM|nr:hypothetical protein [Photobacterium gaetbulicola]AJR05711.1 hypothetical protein H744_1c0686 [Photobacterium gaetbulicola Gung47]PSU14680.1 hypothetical protein C9J03_00965 [Photobacterium gaetbulicola]
MEKILILLIIVSSYAYSWDNGGVNTYINNVTVLQDGEFYVDVTDDICGEASNKRVGYVFKNATPNSINQSEAGVSMLLSTALTAQTTQSPVRIYADNGNGAWACKMGAIKIMK